MSVLRVHLCVCCVFAAATAATTELIVASTSAAATETTTTTTKQATKTDATTLASATASSATPPNSPAPAAPTTSAQTSTLLATSRGRRTGQWAEQRQQRCPKRVAETLLLLLADKTETPSTTEQTVSMTTATPDVPGLTSDVFNKDKNLDVKIIFHFWKL